MDRHLDALALHGASSFNAGNQQSGRIQVQEIEANEIEKEQSA